MANANNFPNPSKTPWADMAGRAGLAGALAALGWTEDGIGVLAGMVADDPHTITDFATACYTLDSKGIPLQPRSQMAASKQTYLPALC